jgi:ech hydrogenase subunit D
MMTNITEVTTQSLLYEVALRRPQGYRFVTITCADLGDAHDILYHFDRDYKLDNLRLRLPKGQPLPSISNIYAAAMLVENEVKDLFGVNVTGLSLDFGGRLLLTEDAPKAPMNKDQAPATPAASAEGKGGAQ